MKILDSGPHYIVEKYTQNIMWMGDFTVKQ